MLNLQTEVERIIKYTGDYDCFITDEPFSRNYRFADYTLVLTKMKNILTMMFSDCVFKFKLLPYNPKWYPIQVVKGIEMVSIVINYENGRAYSSRNWHRFLELAEEVAKLMIGMEAEILIHDHKQMSEENRFKQISLW